MPAIRWRFVIEFNETKRFGSTLAFPAAASQHCPLLLPLLLPLQFRSSLESLSSLKEKAPLHQKFIEFVGAMDSIRFEGKQTVHLAQFAQHTNKIDSLSSYYILTLEHSLRSFSFYSTFLLPFVSSPSKTVIRNKGPHPLSQFLPCDAAEAPSISRVGHKSCNPYPFKNQRSPLDKEYTVSVHSTRARARKRKFLSDRIQRLR